MPSKVRRTQTFFLLPEAVVEGVLSGELLEGASSLLVLLLPLLLLLL
jgi:hypothetical protein